MEEAVNVEARFKSMKRYPGRNDVIIVREADPC